MSNKGHDNLIPANRLTEEELRAMTSNGGKRSGEVRRRKKKMKEILSYMLHDAKLTDALRDNLAEQGVSEEDMNHLAVVTRSLVAKAEQGDVSAYNTIAAMMGEKPKEEYDLDMAMKVEYVDSAQGLAHSEDEIKDEG